MTDSTPIRWLDGEAPAQLSGGTTWGMPFARGSVPAAAALSVMDASGDAVAAQSWPLATWPDGSLKWAGIALPATDSPSAAYLVRSDGGASPRKGNLPPSDATNAASGTNVTVTETPDTLTVDTGTLRMVLNRSGSTLFSSLTRNGAEVARDARLASLVQDALSEGAGTFSREAFAGGLAGE